MCPIKIFGIGFSRTGTRSLARALQLLGYTSIHFPETLRQIDRYDASVDTSVTLAYKTLDLFYPRALFILTTRNLDDWVRSFVARFGGAPFQDETIRGKVRYALFGDLPFNEESSRALKAIHAQHIMNVKHHFARRPRDLLVFDVFAGDGWQKLCQFLGHPHNKVPETPFPHEKWHSWDR